MLVVCLPFSDRFWAQGFTDMTRRSWQEGQMRAFEEFGGVPGMLVPDNAATATDRSAARVTLVDREYERFAEHYGTAVVPARGRVDRQPGGTMGDRAGQRDDILHARRVQRVLRGVFVVE